MSRLDMIELLDGYLMGGITDRAVIFERIRAWKPDLDTAVPIVKAIALVGPKAADESLIALRIVLAGCSLDDERVREVRAAVKDNSGGDVSARARYNRLLAGTS